MLSPSIAIMYFIIFVLSNFPDTVSSKICEMSIFPVYLSASLIKSPIPKAFS